MAGIPSMDPGLRGRLPGLDTTPGAGLGMEDLHLLKPSELSPPEINPIPEFEAISFVNGAPPEPTDPLLGPPPGLDLMALGDTALRLSHSIQAFLSRSASALPFSGGQLSPEQSRDLEKERKLRNLIHEYQIDWNEIQAAMVANGQWSSELSA